MAPRRAPTGHRRRPGGGGLGSRRSPRRGPRDDAGGGAGALPRAGAGARQPRAGRQRPGRARSPRWSRSARPSSRPEPGWPTSRADGLSALHGSQEETIAAARRALGRPARMGAGPTRFCALAAALAARSRRALVLEGSEAARWLAGRPVGCSAFREETAMLVAPLHASGRAHARRAGEARPRGPRPIASGRPGRSPTGWPAGRTRPLQPAPGGAAGGVDGGRRRRAAARR